MGQPLEEPLGVPIVMKQSTPAVAAGHNVQDGTGGTALLTVGARRTS